MDKLIFLVFVAIVSMAIGSCCWTYSINSWLAWASSPNSISWWQGAAIGLVPGIGQLSLPVAVVTWIVGLFF